MLSTTTPFQLRAASKHAQRLSRQLDLHRAALLVGQRLPVALDQRLQRVARRQANDRPGRTAEIYQPLDLAGNAVLRGCVPRLESYSFGPNGACSNRAARARLAATGCQSELADPKSTLTIFPGDRLGGEQVRNA